MNSFAAEFERRLKDKLTAEIAELDASIVSGQLNTIEQYKNCTGRRQALCDAFQMCSEVAEELAKLTRM